MIFATKNILDILQNKELDKSVQEAVIFVKDLYESFTPTGWHSVGRGVWSKGKFEVKVIPVQSVNKGVTVEFTHDKSHKLTGLGAKTDPFKAALFYLEEYLINNEDTESVFIKVSQENEKEKKREVHYLSFLQNTKNLESRNLKTFSQYTFRGAKIHNGYKHLVFIRKDIQ